MGYAQRVFDAVQPLVEQSCQRVLPWIDFQHAES
jgi:hypothetical protein